MPEVLRYEAADAVATITLDRPAALNALDTALKEALRDAVQEAAADDAIRAVVLTGAGRAFCVGQDLREHTGNLAADPEGTWDTVADHYTPIALALATMPKPVVAAVNGMACGGAFYLLGEVDFMIAAESATFFDPHLTYGMTSVFEPILMMPRMPFGELMRMTLMASAERMTASRAHQIGLVSEVVPDERLLEAATDAARIVASWPPAAVQSTVRTLWAARELSTRHASELGNEFLNLGTSLSDLREGQEAFTQGRRIEWRAR